LPGQYPSKKHSRDRILRSQKKIREALKARNYPGQIKEFTIKLILYNLSKIIYALLICISAEEF